MTNHAQNLPQTVILTGGTSGVGYAAARTIATWINGLATVRSESSLGVISADIGRIVDCNPVPGETENRRG